MSFVNSLILRKPPLGSFCEIYVTNTEAKNEHKCKRNLIAMGSLLSPKMGSHGVYSNPRSSNPLRFFTKTSLQGVKLNRGIFILVGSLLSPKKGLHGVTSNPRSFLPVGVLLGPKKDFCRLNSSPRSCVSDEILLGPKKCLCRVNSNPRNLIPESSLGPKQTIYGA